MPVVGNPCPRPRQILATTQVGSPLQKEVVQLPLFAPFRVALVFAQLVVAQALEGFTLAACLLKDFLLLVPQNL